MSVRKYLNFHPAIDESAYIDENATVIGRAKIGKNVSIWPGAVVRADINEIIIGDGSNVQDGAVVHVTYELPAVIGSNVTLGHLATVHGAVIGDGALIGIGAIILDGAEIGRNTIVAAGSLVPPNAKVPPNSMLMGSPAKVVRELKPAEIESIVKNGRTYVEIIKNYKGNA